MILNESQVQALEHKKHDDTAAGEIETGHPGYLGSEDTFYMGKLKGADMFLYEVCTFAESAMVSEHVGGITGHEQVSDIWWVGFFCDLEPKNSLEHFERNFLLLTASFYR